MNVSLWLKLLSVLFCGLVLLITAAGVIGFWMMVRYPKKTDQEINVMAAQYGIDIPEVSSEGRKQLIPFEDGTLSESLIFPGDPERLVIMVHGVSGNKYLMLKYLPLFEKTGETLLLVDLRRYTNRFFSHRGFPAFGNFEHKDLVYIMNHLDNDFPKVRHITLLGESMGGSTVLLAAAVCGNKISRVIADSPFYSTLEMQRSILKKLKIPFFLHRAVLNLTDLLLKRFAGYSHYDPPPGEVVKDIKCPVFLAHGSADRNVPDYMSEKIYNNLSDQIPKMRLVIEGAGHTESVLKNFKKYNSALSHFLKKDF